MFSHFNIENWSNIWLKNPKILAEIMSKSKDLTKAVAEENPLLVTTMLQAELDFVDRVFMNYPTLSRRLLVYI